MMTRLLTNADIPAARRLWHICFPEDTEAFLDWFFMFRFNPDFCAGCFEGDRLLSVIHGTRMPLTCRGTVIPALMISGVATEPDMRGRGYMHTTMLFLKKAAAQQGIYILFNHPQNPSAYRHLGFLPCTDTLYFEQPASFFKDNSSAGLSPVRFDEAAALTVYKKASERYAAFSFRDAQSFSLRTKELTLDGGKAFLFYKNSVPCAYCFLHFEGENTAVIDEILSESDYGAILASICKITGCGRLKAKLPPETCLPGIIRVQNIMLAEPDLYRRFSYGLSACYSVDEY